MQTDPKEPQNRAGRDADTTTCPSCRAVLVAGLRFCRMCGYRLGEGVAEYAETQRFDGKLPTAVAPSAADPFAARGVWGGVTPMQPLGATDTSSLRRAASACNPARMGWVGWMILALAILFAVGVGTRMVRGPRGAAEPNVARISVEREVDGFDTADDGGAFVEGLAGPDTSLERAGILGGDVITRFDGKEVADEDDLRRILRATPAGKTVEVVFIRDGETRTAALTTLDRRAFRGMAPIDARPGGRGILGVDDLDRVRVPNANTYGVKLGDIIRNGAADFAGIKEGDIVVEFNGKPTRTEGDLRLRIYEAVPGSTVPVVVIRGGERLEIPVKMGRSKD